ncbi:sterol-sensing domain of SREBP cleavage-activation-domain-containing protein [Jimgerdemannia flammicorona]|uniref:Sterol-sensing domain of SREBP cleavage-activation-domain-containing protein n=1 Tax=Jimgerdemannia flammicorona TaxID=994334 RepID=A0A433BAF4_9FUNG|nr:sterol-sensing domain of SREBP cleavage-activation-domain-containing protein [Jimgerdemannia flammicorona]
MRRPPAIFPALPLLLLLLTVISSNAAILHEKGVCAMRGQCGKKGFVNLNCPYNYPAVEPETETFRSLLIDTCGASFADTPVCCDHDQLIDLVDQVKKAERIIAACPACWNNFLQFFCHFTCSPDQSTFVNVTGTVASSTSDKDLVTRVDFRVADHYGQGFYDSCKDIKFGSSNGYAMDFIGGGARNWHDMVVYMGTERPLIGSPFQIDFPLGPDGEGTMTAFDSSTYRCNDTDTRFRCACVDCESTCPVLPPTPAERPECRIGVLRCWSFGLIILYILIFCLSASVFLAVKKGWAENLTNFNWTSGDSYRGAYERVALEGEDDNTLLDPDQTPRKYWLNSVVQEWFYYLGILCARHPWTTIIVSLVFVTFCSLGWRWFGVEQNPVNLWVPPTSEALAQKQFFDENFSPFYRTTQLIITPSTDFASNTSVITKQNLLNLFALESEIKSLRSFPNNYTLQDLCYHPNGDACIIQSVTGYWQGDVDNFDSPSWHEDFVGCAEQPTNCLPEFGQPLKPEMVLGGYEGREFDQAQALIVTYVLRNYVDETQADKAHEWELTLLKNVLTRLESREEWSGVKVSYSTEVSLIFKSTPQKKLEPPPLPLFSLYIYIYPVLSLLFPCFQIRNNHIQSSLEIELNKSSNTDAGTIILSYLVMFLYASLALGKFSSLDSRRIVIDSKFSLGISGIIIVIASVSTSVGIFSFTGSKITLIIAEVIPFLVLAVGVDNIFILCHEFERRKLVGDVDETIEERAAKTLAKMGPGILMSALCETIAFGLGGLVTMPAVSSFALVAAVAVFVDFVLQVTCFVACMVLDAHRAEETRVDCIPCIQVSAPEIIDREGVLQRWTQHYYAPFILNPSIKYGICLIFLGIFMIGLSLAPQLELGLDQRVALPSDSYLVEYFNDLGTYFQVGPPVYFVVTGDNTTNRADQQKLCGRFSTCDDYSLANILEQERKRPNVSFIAEPTSGWLDDFLHWLSPDVGCCSFKKRKLQADSKYTQSLQAPEKRQMCGPYDDEDECEPCIQAWDITMAGLPQGQEFLDLLDLWLAMEPSEDCPLAGKAAYGDALVIDRANTTIVASHFRTFHAPLRTQREFIAAFHSAHRIAREISTELGVQVYPYSVFYIFFEQYSYIVYMALQILAFAIITIFGVTAAMLGSLRTALIIVLMVVMILVDVLGAMTVWNISLNAVSLVNLVICVGISVEFCCHIARGFVVGTGSREERAFKSLVDVGSSKQEIRFCVCHKVYIYTNVYSWRFFRQVFSGITLTKFAGIIVLAFTRSKIFEIYYFRMCMYIYNSIDFLCGVCVEGLILGVFVRVLNFEAYSIVLPMLLVISVIIRSSNTDLLIVVFGGLHGLVLLPVVLSIIGGEGMGSSAALDEYGFSWARGGNSHGMLVGDADDDDDIEQ